MSLTVVDHSGLTVTLAPPITISLASAPPPPPPPPPPSTGATSLLPGQFIVQTDGTTISATDYTGAVISSSPDLSVVISVIFSRSVSKVCLGPGRFAMSSPLILPHHNCTITGVGTPLNEYGPTDGTVIYTNGYRFTQAQTAWSQGTSFLHLKDLAIYAQDGGNLDLPATLLFCDTVMLGATGSFGLGTVFSLGSGGPPGHTATWHDVYFYDGRTSASGFFLSVWYEGFSLDGGGVTMNANPAGGLARFIKMDGNTYGSFAHMDLYIGGGATIQYEAYIESNNDLYIEEVQFPYLPNIQRAQILDTAGGGRQNYTIIAARLATVGPIFVPSTASTGGGTPVVTLVGAGYK